MHTSQAVFRLSVLFEFGTIHEVERIDYIDFTSTSRLRLGNSMVGLAGNEER